MASSFVFLLTSLLILPAALGGASTANILLSGESLQRNEYLQIGSCQFVVEHDCDLALYDYSKYNSLYYLFNHAPPTWEYTIDPNSYDDNCVLKMQDDGNLVLYNNDNNEKVLWQSGTYNGDKGTYVFVLQSDCNARIFGKLQKQVNS